MVNSVIKRQRLRDFISCCVRSCVILFWYFSSSSSSSLFSSSSSSFFSSAFFLLLRLLSSFFFGGHVPQKIPKMSNKFKAQLTHLMEWEPGIGVIIRLRTGLLTLIFQQHRLWQQLPMNPSYIYAPHENSPSTDILLVNKSEHLIVQPHLRQYQNVSIEYVRMFYNFFYKSKK